MIDGKLIILGIESSCDETAVSLLSCRNYFESSGSSLTDSSAHPHNNSPIDPPELLGSLISSQIPLHRLYGGVVPELASRNHSIALPSLIRELCAESGISPRDIDVFAATAGPGLASSLLVGNTTAKALAYASGKPFVAVNHLEGHLLSPFIESATPEPHLGLVVSGGHTLLIDVQDFGHYTLIGRSLDDAAGEAFDKVGKMLGLPYPGGPEIERCANDEGNPSAYTFPRAMIKEDHANFSFSGLKTAVLYTLPTLVPEGDPSLLSQAQLADLCASFQQAVIDCLTAKIRYALRKTGHRILAVSGGVSCNKTLRKALEDLAEKEGIELKLCSSSLSTDNAAMIAYVGLLKYKHGHIHRLDEDVDPNLPLTQDLNRTKNKRS